MKTPRRSKTLSVPQGEFTLTRYPRLKKDALRAWDAADEYLLQRLAEEGLPAETPNLLVLNDSFGALCAALAQYRPQLWSDSHLAQQGALENFSDNDLDPADLRLLSSLREPDGKIDLLLVRIPKQLAFLEDQLYRVRPHLHAGSRIFGAGMVKDIHTSTLQLFERIIGPTSTSLARKRARLIFCQFDGTSDPGQSPYPTQYQLEHTDCCLLNHANVFSRDNLDIGTRFLLEHIPASDAPLKTADLGCGNGVIGIAAAKRNPAAELFFVDESYMAVESARANFAAVFGAERAARFQVGDGLADCETASLDLVLNNPPFHRERAVDGDAPGRMFKQAEAALKRSGELWGVGNRHLNHQAKLKRLFGHCEEVASNSKFVVLKAVKG